MEIDQDKPSAFKKTYDQLNEKNNLNFPESKYQFVDNLSKIINNFMTPFIKSVAKQQRKTMKQLGLQMAQEQQLIQNPLPKQKYCLPIPTAFSGQETKTDSCKQNEKKTGSKKFTPQTSSKQLEKTKIIKKAQKDDLKEQSQVENNKAQNYQIKNNRIYLKGMPKKPVSSFFFFYKYYSRQLNGISINSNGQRIIEPGPYGSELAKKISQKWKSMTQEEKQPFAKMAQQTKDKYKVDMMNFKQLNKSSFLKIKKKRLQRARYLRKLKKNREEGIQEPLQVKPVPPLIRPAEKNKKSQNKQISRKIQNKNQKGHSSSHSNSQQKKKIIPKKIKNQHKPRAPVPSFFFYYKVIKQEIALQHNIKIGSEIAKIASSKWKLMTEQQKQPYQILARQRRKQYHDQMIIFRQKYPEEAQKMKRQKVEMMEEKKSKKKEKQQAQKQESIVNSQSEDHEDSSQQVDSLQGEVTKTKTNKNEDRKKAQRQKQRSYSEQKKSQTSHQEVGKSHRPKAPISSFFMFFKQNNVILADQFKQSFGAKLVKYASQIWRNMSEQQKRPYQEKSQVTRDQYYQAMNQYKKKYPEEIKQRKIQLKKLKLEKTKKPPIKTGQKQSSSKRLQENDEQIQNSQSIRQNQSSL